MKAKEYTSFQFYISTIQFVLLTGIATLPASFQFYISTIQFTSDEVVTNADNISILHKYDSVLLPALPRGYGSQFQFYISTIQRPLTALKQLPPPFQFYISTIQFMVSLSEQRLLINFNST